MKRKYTKSVPKDPDITQVWKTSRGEFVLISQLPTEHLTRIILLLRKNWKILKIQALNDMFASALQLSLFDIEEGIETVYSSADELIADVNRETVLSKAIPQYRNLLKEAKKRKINLELRAATEEKLKEYFAKKRSRLFE
jgi:hypothetical protein